MTPILAFDIGGTNFRCAIVEGDQIKEVTKQPSPSFVRFRSLSGKELVDQLVDTICGMIGSFEERFPALQTVALAVPGVVTGTGIVVSAPPLWGNLISNVPLRSVIQARTRLRVMVFNDLCGPALFYSQHHGFAQGAEFLMVITLSTGVGCKTVDVKQQRVLLDSGGLGGEIGHVVVDFSDSALPCDCGSVGHLSSYLSGRGLAQLLRLRKEREPGFLHDFNNTSTGDDTPLLEAFAEAVSQHDASAMEVLDFVTARLAYLLHVLSGTFGVDRYVLVGPIAYCLGDYLRTALTRQLQRIGIWNWDASRLTDLIRIGIPDDAIGLLGAARYGAMRPGCPT